MLKEIKRSQVLDLMAEGVPVFMLYRVDMGHTIEDVLGADGFAVKEKPGMVCPAEEVKSDPSEIQVESKSDPNEKKKSKYDKDLIWKLYSEEKMNANQIAERIGGTAGTVAYHIHHLKKARENES